jgi:NAD(P)H-nitrite reductase large subunit
MYIFMGHMKFEHTKPYEDNFWKKNRIDLLQKRVDHINVELKLVEFSDNTSLNYDELVIASGSKPNKFGWAGQDLDGVQCLYHLQDLELMEKNTKGIKNAVVVGGGLIGIEMVEMLLSRNIQVTFLVRENNFWDTVLPLEEAQMINRHIHEHHVNLLLNTELKEIKGNQHGGVKSIVTNKGEEISCEFVGLTVGVSPNIAFLETSGIEKQRGILVNDYFETNVPSVYAIGDCTQLRTPKVGRKAIEAVWYAGRMHGETLAQTLSGNKTPFSPSHWFNSAKFLDIEYQTYGIVSATTVEGENSFYWEHPSRNISFRANYKTIDNSLIGINVLGMRLRHEVVERWLNERKKIEAVINDLQDANFDPEFFSHYDKIIQESFRKEQSRITAQSL